MSPIRGVTAAATWENANERYSCPDAGAPRSMQPAARGRAVSSTPELPTTENTLSIVLEDAVDPNCNDEVGYAIVWQRDGVEVADLADLMEVDASQTAKGETWEVFVTLSDGNNDQGIGEAFSASVVLGNATPKLTNLAITSDALSITFDVEDPHDDTLTVTYSWSVDGTELSTTDTLESGYVHRDEVTVTVTVTVDDGEDGIVSASASLSIENSAPTAPVAVVTPGSPSELRDILCEVGVESTDADGESINRVVGVSWTLFEYDSTTPATPCHSDIAPRTTPSFGSASSTSSATGARRQSWRVSSSPTRRRSQTG